MTAERVMKRAQANAAEIAELLGELGVPPKPQRGRPRTRPEPEPKAAPPEGPHLNVALRKHSRHGYIIVFPRADKRKTGPRLYAKVLKQILASLPKTPNAETRHAATRLSMLRVTVDALSEAQLRGEEIDTSIFLGAIIEEISLAAKLGISPRVPDGSATNQPPTNHP
jgi:hypothetical protein